jgi:hypothetical protein
MLGTHPIQIVCVDMMGDSPQSPAQNTVYRPNNTTRLLGVYEVEYVSKGYERI